MSTKGVYNLGSLRGIGSTTRMLNYCKQTSLQPWDCINQFINVEPTPIPVPVPGKMKSVFLLELTNGLVSKTDNIFKNTADYYWDNYPQEFTKCPIVDTQGILSINLQLLDEYYNLGFRYFVGFTSSNIMQGVLQWFDFHPDAVGFTNYGNADILSIPKNIYRIKPSNYYRLSSILTEINNAIINNGNIYSVTNSSFKSSM